VSREILNAFSIDVEEWFHILDLENAPSPGRWSELEARIERNTERLLGVLDEAGVRCTCFVLGWVVEHHPELVRRIAAAGHEIASHGYGHERVDRLGPEGFRRDVERALVATQDLLGVRPVGYRAPGFSITERTPWAFEVLADLGLRFDSSIFPAAHGHGGIAAAERLPHRLSLPQGKELLEFPISVTTLLGRRTGYCGGGYLRLFPYPFVRSRILAANRRCEPVIVYVHPRDLDSQQPRIAMPARRRFKSYVNLRTTESKLRRLVRDFRFAPVSEALAGVASLRSAA
jgi:polysaccharide deacetylase family protein (PEP-CTERM system associated)